MKHFIKTAVRRLGVAAFWAAVLLVLPNCTLDTGGEAGPGGGGGGTDPVANLKKGDGPRSDVIFCDIEKERRCATDEDLAYGISLTAAAVALNNGLTSGNIGLDYSPEAMAKCTDARPQTVVYEGKFPDGLPVCLNCGDVLGTQTYADVSAACVAQCYDLHGKEWEDGSIIPENPPSAETKAICDPATVNGILIQPARASTNMPLDTCFPGACPDEGGDLKANFVDPRRTPEPVQWQDTVGTTAGPGSNLTRTAANPTMAYDAGAVSTQWFTRGDGYVEFGAGSNTTLHVLGLSIVPAPCVFPCTDASQDYATIDYAFVLGSEGNIYVYLAGAFVKGPLLNGSFGSYTATDRLRVSWTNNPQLDGTASVTFGRVVLPPCTVGMPCSVTPLFTAAPPASYPLRVDTSFLEPGSTLTDVRVVYIK